MHVTAASFKFKYTGGTFLVVLLAALGVAALFFGRHAADTRSLTVLAENAARERVDPELTARARSIAAHAADSVAGAVRAGDTSAIQRRLQPFTDDSTVAALTLTSSSGRILFTFLRSNAVAPGALSTTASTPVRTLAENIPGAVTPETLATLTVVLEQAAPVPSVGLDTRLLAANTERSRLTDWLALGLAAAASL